MKRLPIAGKVLFEFWAMVLTCQFVSLQGLILPAYAQTLPNFEAAAQEIRSATAYPSSSQRFFEAGQMQFEVEIRRLQRVERQSTPLLRIQTGSQTNAQAGRSSGALENLTLRR